MAYAHDGQRINIKMSDMRTATGHLGVNFNMQEMYTVKHAVTQAGIGSGFEINTGVVKNRSDASGYRVSGNVHLSGTSTTTHTDAVPVIHKSATGRYRSGTGAPTTFQLPTRTADNDSNPNQTGSNVKFGEFVGVSNMIFPTDQCGWTSAATGTYYQSSEFGPPVNLNIPVTRDSYYYNGSTRTLGGTNTNAYGPGQGFTNRGRFEVQGNKGYGVTEDNLAWTVGTTFHNNQWREFPLNTIAGVGDRVVVVVQSGGGTMYTFSNTDPIYLRTSTGGSISGVQTTTHYGPTKNSTGNDTWVAVYSALLSSTGGAAYVGVNPFHSSTQRYIFHCFVLRKGQSSPGINNVVREKHGGVTNGSGYFLSTQNFQQSILHGNSFRAFFITIATSNGTGSGTSTQTIAPTSTSNYDLAFCGHGVNGIYQSGTSNQRYGGEWSVTVNNYTGGAAHSMDAKFNTSTTYGNGTTNTYMPGHGSNNRKGTFKKLANDHDVIMITGYQ